MCCNWLVTAFIGFKAPPLSFSPVDVAAPIHLFGRFPDLISSNSVAVLANPEASCLDRIAIAIRAISAESVETYVFGKRKKLVGADNIIRKSTGAAIVVLDWGNPYRFLFVEETLLESLTAVWNNRTRMVQE